MNRFANIPINYNGINFRSLLEATWAALFDLLGWQWQYEPMAFRGWIPDFALYGAKQITYVEVKPVVITPKSIQNEIDKADCNFDVLILGQTCPLPERVGGEDYGIARLGWLGQSSEFLPGHAWGMAVLGKWKDHREIDFCHDFMSYHSRINGAYSGKPGGDDDFLIDEVLELWKKAKNITQWRRSEYSFIQPIEGYELDKRLRNWARQQFSWIDDELWDRINSQRQDPDD